MRPKYSLIFPCYNAQTYLEQAINSVIAQSNINWELIIVDDASTDNSPCILETYAQHNSRITLIKFEINKGQGYARNHAIEKAKGDYVVFLDADDILAFDALTFLQESIAKKRDTEVFVWGYQTKTPNAKNEKKYLPRKQDKKRMKPHFIWVCWDEKGLAFFLGYM